MVNKVKASKMPTSLFIDDAKTLGELIKAKRTGMGMKLADCAALCGISINTLSRIENGQVNSTLSAIFSVLNGLGIKLTSKELSASETFSSTDYGWI
ncbi:MAG: transcriptional regulator [Gammaproteobacteria bacterium]|nr:MAG: transcriptional regulator [Gammaproteobacteria bacterium]